MGALYTLSIYIYNLLINIASAKNRKAQFWVKGRKNIFQKITNGIQTSKPVYWFHCASLGEFEQGRPVIERLKSTKDCFILLTFFSPSGYEVQKNYKHADFVCYLPIDSKINAKKFIRIVKPKAAIFIKYEFWFNYLSELKENNIETYLVSGIFRPQQHFFKFYGKWFKKQLSTFNYFFVQNEESFSLLKSIGYSNTIISGDTRFDRVKELTDENFNNPVIESFCKESKVVVAGSTWEKEHEFICQFANSEELNFKFLIAPHEVNQKNTLDLKNRLGNKSILLSETKENQDLSNFNILIIDKIGLLSKLYRFAYLSIIGGGFRSGIHNTLEAAAYGSPIMFGPNYHKFQEAKDLVELGSAKPMTNYTQFKNLLMVFLNSEDLQEICGLKSSQYVKSRTGATDLILKKIS